MNAGIDREFGIAKSRARHGLFIGFGLAALGSWTLVFAGESVPDRHWLGPLTIALGLGMAIYAWRLGAAASVQLRMDARGVWFKDWGVTLPWHALGDVYQTGSRLQPFVTLRIADPETFVASLSEAEARALRGNRLWKRPELRIPNGVVDASFREIIEALLAARRMYG